MRHRRSLAPIAPLVLLALAACEQPPTARARAAEPVADASDRCAFFPPHADGDPNAGACRGATGQQTAYCHLHTGGPGRDGCDDLPGGPSPQLHCLVPGQAEDGGHLIPVYGGGLDCGDEGGDDGGGGPGAPAPGGPAPVEGGVMRVAPPQPGPCDEANHGIEVTLVFPENAAECTCCVIPLTGDDPDVDCAEEECVEVRFGEGCGVPTLTEAARQRLCDAYARRDQPGYTCMDKPCRYEDDPHCLDKDGAYVPCDRETCCEGADGGLGTTTLGACLADGGRDLGPDFEDCFGPGEPTPIPHPIEER